MNNTFAREHSATAMHQRAAKCSLVQARCNLIRKTGEHASLDRAWRRFGIVRLQSFITRDGKELFPQLSGFPGCACIYRKSAATARIEIVPFSEAKCPGENK